MKFILYILPLLLSLSSCKWFTEANRPFYAMTKFKIPDGTPAFQSGYKDGCNSILYARGNPLYKTKLKGYRFDPKMVGNTEYRFGHSRGWAFCFMTAIGQVHSSFDNYLNYYDPTMMSQDYNTTGDGLFDGVFSQSVTTPGNGLNGIFDVLQSGSSGTSGGGVFNSNPLWAGGSLGQIFGQQYNGSYYGQ